MSDTTPLSRSWIDPVIVAGCRIEEMIGSGGMGVVYRAVQLDLQRPVAVKILAPEFTADEGCVRQFEQEARTLARISHPNIVQVYFAGRDDGRPFVVMEYVEGRDLADLLELRGRLEVVEGTRLILQAARALVATSNQSIIHGDIKPGNIIVTHDGVAKVADFGVARMAGERRPLTAGTPHYMSPEQCMGGSLDSRSDLYSLGLTYWHVLTGQLPFADFDPHVVMRKQVDEALPDVRTLVPGVPDEVAVLLGRMMEKTPDRRVQTALEVTQRLEHYLVSGGPGGSPAGGSLVLVVDDDEWIRVSVRAVLEEQGFQVVTAASGVEALATATRLKPDLIILDVLLPDRNGWTVFRVLRSRPEFALVPVIFLTALDSVADRIHGFRLGADDFVVKPFLFGELTCRVARALSGRARLVADVHAWMRESPPPGSSGVSGTLDQVGLASLLSLLEMERRSGVIIATRTNPSALGRIFVRKGQVVGAQVERSTSLHGAEAVFEMLRWAEGSFEFTILDIDITDEIGTPTAALLLEGARRLDEDAPA